MPETAVVIHYAGGYESIRIIQANDMDCWIVQRRQEGEEDWHEVGRFSLPSTALFYVSNTYLGWSS